MQLKHWVIFNLTSSKLTEHSFPWPSIWATTCYHLWRWRNSDIHDPSFSRHPNPVSLILNYLSFFFAKNPNTINPSSGRVTQLNIRWMPPKLGWIKLNSDGASKSESNLAACGGVFSDHDGHWLLGFSQKLGFTNAYLAELWGILIGLQIAKERGFTKLEVEVDSMAAVKCLVGSGDGDVLPGNVIRRIRDLLSQTTWATSLSHSFREANFVADGLASLGCTNSIDTPLVVYPSPLLVSSTCLILIFVESLLQDVLECSLFSWAFCPQPIKKKVDP